MPKKAKTARPSKPDGKSNEIHKSRPKPPRKAASAYFCYAKARQPILYKERPNERARNIVIQIAEEWRSMGQKEKAPFEETAKKDAERYTKERQEYKAQRGETKEKPISISPAKKDLPPTPSTALPVCPTHKDPFKYWCKSCSDWICEFCVTKHSADGHACVHLLDFAQNNLLAEIVSIAGQYQATSGVTKSMSDNLARLVDTYKKLVTAYSAQLKTVGDAIESIDAVNKKYKNANQSFASRVEEMKVKVPELIKSKDLGRLYDYLKKVEKMKKTTQTDDKDVMALETLGSQLSAFIADSTKPVDLILESTRDLIKRISALSDI